MRAQRWMRMALNILAALLLGSGNPSQADEPAKSDNVAKPPYQRLLQGEDARKAAAQAKRMADLQQADNYSEAIQAAEGLLTLRRRAQGGDHYEAVNLHWELEALRKVAALPADKRAAWR